MLHQREPFVVGADGPREKDFVGVLEALEDAVARDVAAGGWMSVASPDELAPLPFDQVLRGTSRYVAWSSTWSLGGRYVPFQGGHRDNPILE